MTCKIFSFSPITLSFSFAYNRKEDKFRLNSSHKQGRSQDFLLGEAKLHTRMFVIIHKYVVCKMIKFKI